MINALIMAGGLALIVAIFALADWYTRRKDAQSQATSERPR
jgi:hypothetical protein